MFKRTDQQQAIADYVAMLKGNIGIEAVAGSGKTTTAIDLIENFIPRTQAVLYMAFNKKIQVSTNDKFKERGLSKATAKTFNSLAYGAYMQRYGIKSFNDIKMDDAKYLKMAVEWVNANMSHLSEEDRDIASDIIANLIHFARVNTTYAAYRQRDLVVLTGKTLDGDAIYTPLPNAFFDEAEDILETIAWRYDLFGQLENANDEMRLLKAIPALLRTGKTMMEVQNSDYYYVCNFTDQVYWMVVEQWKVWKSQWVIVDEAQDLSPLFRALVDNAIWYPSGHVIVIGDPCQPEGTLVSMADGTQKPIECLTVGDRVVSYNARDNAFRKAGRTVTGITKRPFIGNIISVEMDNGLKSEYTPNHHCYANFSPLRNKYAVYMMRKGSYYRVGIARMDYASERLGCGVVRRMRDEQADAAWILDVYDSRADAFVMEEAISGKFGIPQLRFVDAAKSVVMNNERLASAWKWIGENHDRANECLSYFGRDINYPLVTNEPGKYISLKRPMIVHAANLMNGILMLPYTGHVHPKNIALDSAWKQIKIGSRTYDGFVYSLNVETDHLYIADNIVTHNCQAIYAFTGADNSGFQNSMKFWNAEKVFPLTFSWRCPKKVAELAREWVPAFEAAPNAIDGEVLETSEEALVRNALPGEAIISRTRGPMIPIWQKLVGAGKPAIIIGSDVSKQIVKILERVSKRKGFEFGKLAEALQEYENKQIQKMQARKKGDDEIDNFRDQMSAVNGAVDAVQADSMPELIEKIKAIFSKNDEAINESDAVVIMTGHQSKGLEFDTVYMLTPGLFPMRHPKMSADQEVQELNLKYVVQTRAMKRLLMVTSKKEPTKKEEPKQPVLETPKTPLETAIDELDVAVQKLLEAPIVEVKSTDLVADRPRYNQELVEQLITECLKDREHTGHPIMMINRLRELAVLADKVRKSVGNSSSNETVDSIVRVV